MINLISVSFYVFGLFSIFFPFLIYYILYFMCVGIKEKKLCLFPQIDMRTGKAGMWLKHCALCLIHQRLFATPDKILTNPNWVQHFSTLAAHQIHFRNFLNADAWHLKNFRFSRSGIRLRPEDCKSPGIPLDTALELASRQGTTSSYAY